MTRKQVTVETLPAPAPLGLSFEIRNGGGDGLELVAVEQDVYCADGALVQRRAMHAETRIGPGEQRTIRDPLPELSPALRPAALVYTFAFRGPAGELSAVAVRCSPSERGEPAADEHTIAPTPRLLARAWFEALCELGVYAVPSASSLSRRRDRRLVRDRMVLRDDASSPVGS